MNGSASDVARPLQQRRTGDCDGHVAVAATSAGSAVVAQTAEERRRDDGVVRHDQASLHVRCAETCQNRSFQTFRRCSG